MPDWRCNSPSSRRICACVVTSRAVVGSSAMSRSGSFARAMAIMTRLALAARQLVRPGIEPQCRIGELYPLEQFHNSVTSLVTTQSAVKGEGLAHLALDRVQRIQTRHRLLEDHRDAVAADGLQSFRRRPEQLFAAKADRSRGVTGSRVGKQLEHTQSGHRLARSRFPHEGDGPSPSAT